MKNHSTILLKFNDHKNENEKLYMSPTSKASLSNLHVKIALYLYISYSISITGLLSTCLVMSVYILSL